MKRTVASPLSLCPLLSLVLCTVSLDPSQIQVYPENGGTSGVFLATLHSKGYSFNATTAVKVCTSLNVRIATKAEVEKAHSNGLQTCRYGWVKEQIPVIPRIEENEKCAQKKVGVITWTVPLDKLFDVFCFNSTGQSEATTDGTPGMMTPADRSTPSKTATPSLILSTLFNKHFLPSSPSTPSISSGFSTSVASTLFLSSTDSAAPRIPQSLSPSTTQHPLTTSSSSSSAASFSSTFFSFHSFTNSSSVNTLSHQTDQPAQPKPTSCFGEVPTACVVIAVMLILMAAAGGIWYFKIKRAHGLPPWVRIRHEDAFGTEMSKHTDGPNFSKKKKKGDSSDDLTLQSEEDTESP